MKFLENFMKTNKKHYWYDLNIRTYVNKISLSAKLISSVCGNYTISGCLQDYIVTSPFFFSKKSDNGQITTDKV